MMWAAVSKARRALVIQAKSKDEEVLEKVESGSRNANRSKGYHIYLQSIKQLQA